MLAGQKMNQKIIRIIFLELNETKQNQAWYNSVNDFFDPFKGSIFSNNYIHVILSEILSKPTLTERENILTSR